MSALSRLGAAWSALTAPASAPAPASVDRRSKGSPPGGYGMGTGYVAGPYYTDAFGAHAAPTPWGLVEAYKSLIYACVAINEQAVVRIPLRLYADASRPGGQPRDFCQPRAVPPRRHEYLRSLQYLRALSVHVSDVKEIGHHPILETLDRPDPYGYFDRHSLLSLICRQCDVIGTSYLFPDGPKTRPPKWFWPLLSQYVIPIRASQSVLIDYFQYFGDRLGFADVLRFRTKPSLKDPYGAGYSPTYAAIEYARLEDQFVSIQDQLLSSGPRPNIIFSTKDPSLSPGDKERERFEHDLNRKLSGPNAGKHLVTNGAWDITPVSYSPQDLAGLKISEYDRERIGNCFGVPPPYLTGDTNMANMQAADVFHTRNAVEPRCHMIASTLTQLVKTYDERLFFAFDPASPEDEEKIARIIDMNLKNGRITINQANTDSPFPNVSWGNEPWISSGLLQPTMVQETHDQKMESARISSEAAAAQAEMLKSGRVPPPGAANREPSKDKSMKAGQEKRPAADAGTEAKAKD